MSHRAPALFIGGPPDRIGHRSLPAPQPGRGALRAAKSWSPRTGLCRAPCLDPQRRPPLTASPAVAVPPPGGGILRSIGSDAEQGSKSHSHAARRGMLHHVKGRALRLFGVTHKEGRWGTAAQTCGPRRRAGSVLSPGVICACIALP